MKPNYVLKKDLPNCPKGRVFKPTFDGTHYFMYMTDNEAAIGKLHYYKFKADIVENNPTWFKVEKMSDLNSRLQTAMRKKQDAERQIVALRKMIKNNLK